MQIIRGIGHFEGHDGNYAATVEERNLARGWELTATEVQWEADGKVPWASK